jgi:hypothetical protein
MPSAFLLCVLCRRSALPVMGTAGFSCVCVRSSCVTFEDGDLSSASRLRRACSVGAEQGVAWQIEHVAKGRPLRLMRINGRSVVGSILAIS